MGPHPSSPALRPLQSRQLLVHLRLRRRHPGRAQGQHRRNHVFVPARLLSLATSSSRGFVIRSELYGLVNQLLVSSTSASSSWSRQPRLVANTVCFYKLVSISTDDRGRRARHRPPRLSVDMSARPGDTPCHPPALFLMGPNDLFIALIFSRPA